MAVKDEIINIIQQGTMEWEQIRGELEKKGHKKNTIAMAKKRMIESGEIKEEFKGGKKIISVEKDISINYFDEDKFYREYESILRTYFIRLVSENPNYHVLDVKDFMLKAPHMADIADDIANNPTQCRRIITSILYDVYNELDFDPEDRLITFKNIPGRFKAISQIDRKDINKLIEFEGAIIQSSKMMTRTVKAKYMCLSCGKTREVGIGLWTDPQRLKMKCSCGNDMMYLDSESEYTNFQEILIQQTEIGRDGKHHSAPVFIEGLEQGIFSGKVRITAIPIKKNIKNTSASDICLHGIHCELIEEFNIDITEEDILNIEKVAQDKDAPEKIANFMFKKIYGHTTIKKTIFLQQLKGSKKGDTDKQNINILLVTDPGSGKTTLMRELENYPHVKYASLTTSSGPGLTAAVVKEKTEFGDGWVVKPGAYALADGGTLALDEISTNKLLHSTIMEPLESQQIHINKAGIDMTLPARCATLAACNPRFGNFDPNQSVMEQIGLAPQMIDRFDLIFPLQRDYDLSMHEAIANHIIEEGNNLIEGKKEKIEINGVELSVDFVSKYIVYAEQINPKIGKKPKEMIIKYYLKLINSAKSNNSLPVSPRQLNAILRLAEAHAKARLSDVVEVVDAQQAIEIMDECFNKVAYDPETGQYDIGKMYGTTHTQQRKMANVVKIIEELQALSDNRLAQEQNIIEIAKEKYDIDEVEVDKLLEQLKKVGEIISPRFGYYKTT